MTEYYEDFDTAMTILEESDAKIDQANKAVKIAERDLLLRWLVIYFYYYIMIFVIQIYSL